MPEGHTLFRLATELDDAFAGQALRVTSPQGRFADGAAVVDGQVMTGAESAGKHVFLVFEQGDIVHIHLGLIGVFTIANGPAPEPVGAVRLRLEGERAYGDLRGAIVCELVSKDVMVEITGKLGPDPLRADADPDRAFARIHRSAKPIGALLMDQSVLSGVGNVFRAEVLFRARLNPLVPGTKVTRRRWNAMWDDLVFLMEYGVRTGRIDTVRPEHEPEAMGRPARVDDHGGEVYVYRRDGRPCHACGATIRTRLLEGRNLFWCPTCQRKR
jgi:formamidopyrimidine-DNA glycosylase